MEPTKHLSAVSPRVLVVEDEKMLSDSYSFILSSSQYLVDVAANGIEALELCQKNTYHLILLDIMMPVLDGLGFLKQFKPAIKSKPRIIILSNLPYGEEIKKAIHLGASSYIQKSDIIPRKLLDVMNNELAAT